MGRIFLTGDKHFPAEYKLLSYKHWPMGRDLNRDDYVIVLGDFGIVWDNSKEENYWLDWFDARPWTTLFIDGNHQNFPLLNSYPTELWMGGRIHMLRPHLRHLMRGEIFNLNNKTFFCFGGARSTDRHLRKEGKSWWSEEQASREEMEHAVDNLEKVDYNVDYVLTHCAPNYIVDRLYPYENQHDPMTNFLEKIVRAECIKAQFFCGHYHVDCSYDNNKYNILYDDIVELLPNNEIKVVNN